MIDQRGALKKMMSALGMEATKEKIEQFKTLISQELTPYASAILLDPEYGLPAAQKRAAASGLLLAYEKLVMIKPYPAACRICCRTVQFCD